MDNKWQQTYLCLTSPSQISANSFIEVSLSKKLNHQLVKGWSWKCSVFFLLLTNSTMHWFYNIVCAPRAWCSLFLCASEIHCCRKTSKNTSVSHANVQSGLFLYRSERGRCTFYFEAIPHTLPRCHKYSLTDIMCINLRWKIDPWQIHRLSSVCLRKSFTLKKENVFVCLGFFRFISLIWTGVRELYRD